MLQIAFAWDDSHLHEFQVGARRFGRPDVEDGWAEPDDTENENGTTLSQAMRRNGARLLYVFDFGDSWEHEIVVEGIVPAEPNIRYPRCLDGRRASPPEDCGGASGYGELLRVLSDPRHEEYAERREWLGHGFDPERFDLAATNRALTRALTEISACPRSARRRASVRCSARVGSAVSERRTTSAVSHRMRLPGGQGGA